MTNHLDQDDLDWVWRALANPHRREMLDLLSEAPLTTVALSDHFPDLTRFAVMQHLRVLEEGGLVVHRRDGRKRFNYINPVPIQQIYRRWVKRYQEPWAEALVALKDSLEIPPQDQRQLSDTNRVSGRRAAKS
jgi:DNA-binding transcriptional ArsR family regulator